MFHGVVTLMTRSLRLEARLLRTHLFRLVFVFFIYVMMLIAQAQSLMVGAPGKDFFQQMIFLNLAFIALGGVSFFSTAVTEEKEEQTLGLLMMTGLNPLGILFGKSTARLLQAGLLLTVQFPFTLLAITLGGVTIDQVLAAYATLLSFTIFLGNAALLSSVVCARSGSAAALTCVWLAAYGFAPSLARQLLALAGGRLPAFLAQPLGWMAEGGALQRLVAITRTGFSDSPLGAQVLLDLVGGLVLFLLSWGLFRFFTTDASSAGQSRGLLARRPAPVRWFAAGRAWRHALIWKDFQYLTGGGPTALLKLVLLLLTYPFIAVCLEYGGGVTGPTTLFETTLTGHLVIAGCVLLLESSIYASRVFHDEIKAQTMSSLLILPHSIGYVAYSKVAGCLLALAPGLLFIAVDAALLPNGPHEAFRAVAHPGFWAAATVVLTFLHLVVLLSLFVKWGALPLAFLVTLMSQNCCPLPLMVMMIADEPGPASLVADGILWVMIGVIGFVFQMMIHARLYELGTK